MKLTEIQQRTLSSGYTKAKELNRLDDYCETFVRKIALKERSVDDAIDSALLILSCGKKYPDTEYDQSKMVRAHMG